MTSKVAEARRDRGSKGNGARDGHTHTLARNLTIFIIGSSLDSRTPSKDPKLPAGCEQQSPAAKTLPLELLPYCASEVAWLGAFLPRPTIQLPFLCWFPYLSCLAWHTDRLWQSLSDGSRLVDL